MNSVSKIRVIACVLLSQAFSLSAGAQVCDNASSLNISTGITAAGAKITTNTADPFWDIDFLSSDVAPYGTIGNAFVIPPGTPNKPGLWYSSSTAEWISIATFHYPTTTTGTYEIRLKREFRLCKDDDLEFLLNIANDNYCTDVRIDGVSVLPVGSFPQAVSGSSANLTATSPCNFNKSLLAGLHDITITFYNFPLDAPTGQPQGLLLEGAINSLTSTSSLVTNASDSNCSCSSSCNDSCYWRVDGNTILGGKNTFGTVSNDDVLIKTNNTSRGMMSNTGLLGWNTLAPTAYLHVNCTGHNLPQSGTSDIRFENLEQGEGSVLVIDNNTGYVFNSFVSLTSINMLTAENKRLTEELVSLKEQVAMIQSKMDLQTSKSQPASKSYLVKNVPNPFENTTSIEYFLDAAAQNAQILITDMSGKLVRTIPISQPGFGSVTVEMSGLSSGMYQYSLSVDGRQTDTRKMISK